MLDPSRGDSLPLYVSLIKGVLWVVLLGVPVLVGWMVYAVPRAQRKRMAEMRAGRLRQARDPATSTLRGAQTRPSTSGWVLWCCQYTYWATLWVSTMVIKIISPGSVQTVVMLTPVMAAVSCVWATWMKYQECDEYIRLQILRCVASTAIIVSFGTLAYYFLELRGFPHQSMLWVNLLGWTVFNAQVLLVLLRSR
jgi:hypothetical protein